MVKLLAVTLMLCFCYQIVARLGVVAWYNINKEYVAKVLCENKAKPEMKCCGKCYLRKQLKNTGDNTENAPGKEQVKWEKLSNLVAVLPASRNFTKAYNFSTSEVFNSSYKNLYSFICVQSIFHPPSGVVA